MQKRCSREFPVSPVAGRPNWGSPLCPGRRLTRRQSHLVCRTALWQASVDGGDWNPLHLPPSSHEPQHPENEREAGFSSSFSAHIHRTETNLSSTVKPHSAQWAWTLSRQGAVSLVSVLSFRLSVLSKSHDAQKGKRTILRKRGTFPRWYDPCIMPTLALVVRWKGDGRPFLRVS